mgnify:CR=1 FL=1
MFSIGFSLTRSITVNRPVSEVMAIVGDFNQWNAWSPWIIQEPSCPVTVTGEPSKENHKQHWDGERIGSGQMILTEVIANKQLSYDLEFFKPWKSKSKTQFTFEAITTESGEEATKVNWLMQGSLPFFLFFMKKMMVAFISFDYDRGLNMLQEYIESGSVQSSVEVQGIKKQKGFHYVGFRHKCNIEDIKQVMGPCFQQLIDEKVPLPDMMVTISHKFDFVTGECELTGAFAYFNKPSFDVPTNMVFGEIPEHDGLQVDHTGSYNYLSNGWATAKGYQQYAKLKSLKGVADYEVYRNSPKSVAEEELLTSIILPVKS